MANATSNAEKIRLEEDRLGKQPWRRWGPYLSERQWGTVREDYGPGNTTWDYFPHDHARSRAYRWGEDGIAGICDDEQRLCLSLALWNGRDPILKERLFGLTFATRAEARTAIVEYIEVFYNNQRRHSTLGYVSPTEYERSKHS
jgi:transposase InsO family protein